MFAEAKHRYRSGLSETMEVLSVSSALSVTPDDGTSKVVEFEQERRNTGQLGVPRTGVMKRLTLYEQSESHP